LSWLDREERQTGRYWHAISSLYPAPSELMVAADSGSLYPSRGETE
jgi:hypothetical protein